MKRILTISTIFYAILAVSVACSSADMAATPGGGEGGAEGKGGSMARFTIVGDYIYTVDHRTLRTTRISDPAHPEYLSFKDQDLDFDIETIFSYRDMLFIGSNSAMYIYDISRPEFPERLSRTSHFRSCDPVVASGNYAYVTLNSDNRLCNRGTNELQVYDISDPTSPFMVFQDTNIRAPKGLGVDEAAGRLFVCCRGGLKVYDISDPTNPKWVDDLTNIPQTGNIDTYDVIPYRGLLILIGADGLYQLDYSGDNLSFVSKIDLREGKL